MLVTRLKVFHHVLKILDIGTEGHHFLLAKVIGYVSNILSNTYRVYQYLVENYHSKLFLTKNDQIIIF